MRSHNFASDVATSPILDLCNIHYNVLELSLMSRLDYLCRMELSRVGAYQMWSLHFVLLNYGLRN